MDPLIVIAAVIAAVIVAGVLTLRRKSRSGGTASGPGGSKGRPGADHH